MFLKKTNDLKIALHLSNKTFHIMMFKKFYIRLYTYNLWQKIFINDNVDKRTLQSFKSDRRRTYTIHHMKPKINH